MGLAVAWTTRQDGFRGNVSACLAWCGRKHDGPLIFTRKSSGLGIRETVQLPGPEQDGVKHGGNLCTIRSGGWTSSPWAVLRTSLAKAWTVGGDAGKRRGAARVSSTRETPILWQCLAGTQTMSMWPS